MATFNFPFHKVETRNPESGFSVDMGGNYVFSSKPDAPDNRMFALDFETMRFFENSSGVLVSDVGIQYNMLTLIEFYQTHKLWKSFTYPHPIYGDITVRFARPLVEPKIREETNNGLVEPFQIELREVNQ